MTTVPVVYATRHGSTREIAERIAEVLRAEGLEASAIDAGAPVDGEADAYVIGSAVYIGDWLKEARAFVADNAAALRNHPVWLFSSGPLGTPGDSPEREAVKASLVEELPEEVAPRDQGAPQGGRLPRLAGHRVVVAGDRGRAFPGPGARQLKRRNGEMSKATVTRLFVGGIVALAAGIALVVAAVWVAFAGNVFVMDGPDVVGLKSGTFSWAMILLGFVGVLAVTGGAIAGLVSWIGALMNTSQLDDKAWFVVLLVLGLMSFGFIAMLVYVIAGPDGTQPARTVPQARTGAPA